MRMKSVPNMMEETILTNLQFFSLNRKSLFPIFNVLGIKDNHRKGLKIGEEDDVIVGLAVSWGRRDAYYMSLLQSGQIPDVELSAGIQDEPAVAPNLSLNERIEAIRLMLESKKEQFVKICFDTKESTKVIRY